MPDQDNMARVELKHSQHTLTTKILTDLIVHKLKVQLSNSLDDVNMT